MRYVLAFICVLMLGLVGCSETAGTGGSGGEGGTGGVDPNPYASKDLWLCRPDIQNDRCDETDLSTTEIRPDGTRVLMNEVAPNPDAEVDCFYVYPTMDLSPEPGNTETLFPHPENVILAVSQQAAPYRGVCRMFAPLYHQMTLITYTAYWPNFDKTEFFERAYNDVVDAFDYYMRQHNEGRDFVLIGHSQGSHVLTRLLEDRFDDDEALREQLVSAVLTGPTNRLQVLEGEVVGGSFTNIPLCTSPDESGCVIAFDANPEGVTTSYDISTIYFPPSARACVNPASLNGGSGTLAAFVYPRSSGGLGDFFPDDVDTAWVRYPNIYTSRCSENRDETFVLLVDLASDYTGEVPITPQEIQDVLAAKGSNRNLHSVEPYMASTDIIHIVEQQIASRGD